MVLSCVPREIKELLSFVSQALMKSRRKNVGEKKMTSVHSKQNLEVVLLKTKARQEKTH